MKILAIKLRAIGDTIIWTSALEALRALYPDAEIHVLTYPCNAGVLENSRAVDQIHILKSCSKFALLRKLWVMRAQSFDWLLAFHATQSLLRWSWLANADKMVLHHHSKAYTPRGSERLANPGALEDTISRDLEVVRAMGQEPPRPATKIELRPSEKEWGNKHVEAHIRAVGGDVSKPRLVFLPGASHPLRRYPKDLWLPLIERARAAGQHQVIIMCDGALSEEWKLREDCARLKIPLIDRGSLREFLCCISSCAKALANDSGPGHAAVALGLTTEFVFGPGCVGDWFPYAAPHKVHRIVVPCRYHGPRAQEHFQFCTVNTCSHHTCLRKLSFDIV